MAEKKPYGQFHNFFPALKKTPWPRTKTTKNEADSDTYVNLSLGACPWASVGDGHTLPETNTSPLKNDGWKTNRVLQIGFPICRGVANC